jgi:hypothetical protein
MVKRKRRSDLFYNMNGSRSDVILWLVGPVYKEGYPPCMSYLLSFFFNMKSKAFSLAKKSRLRAQNVTSSSRPPQPRPRRGICRGPTPMDIDRPLGFPVDWDPMEIDDPWEGETMHGPPCLVFSAASWFSPRWGGKRPPPKKRPRLGGMVSF